MIPPNQPANEEKRIAALYEYDLLDSLPEKIYDDITKIAADICGVPISLITLIDRERQWFKSQIGIGGSETHRDHSFCAHAILNPEELFTVADASKDERFSDNPYVLGEPYVAFYAGVPLVTPGGDALGALCVIGDKPNALTKEQRETLRALARQVMAYFELRKVNKLLATQKAEMEELNKDLSRFVHVAAHDMKSPCSSLAMSANYLKEHYSDILDKEGKMFLGMMEDTAMAATNMINGILHHTQTVNCGEFTKESFTFGELAGEVRKLLLIPDGFTFMTMHGSLELYASKYALVQILLNLCNNAIKYNHRPDGIISLGVKDKGSHYIFAVTDNGPGIKPSDQARIFDMFSTLGTKDRYNKMGTGIGLSTVKRLTEKMNGSVQVRSEYGHGSTFEFTVSK